MQSFESDIAAREHVSRQVDIPVLNSFEFMDNGAVLHTFNHDLGNDTFTNVYDLSFRAGKFSPSIELPDQLTGVFDHVIANPRIRFATGGGFFFLADQANGVPRQNSLNLAMTGGQLHNFPVIDREAVLTDGNRLSVEHIQALGVLSIGSDELSWSGSLTGHETDVKVYANGNSVITHTRSELTGTKRVLDEHSRYTPVIYDDKVDIGLIRREDGVFTGISSSAMGAVDIFRFDAVMRMHEKYALRELPEIQIRTIGARALDGSLQGAVSVGPMLDTQNFPGHLINIDKSLGSRPPFLDVPLARTVLYETVNGRVHLCLFDGRPGSRVFPGVTPDQAAAFVQAENDIAWGCFLDPGQTAKLVVRDGPDVASYGNTHYMKWPKQPGDPFIWTPKTGRPVASMITLR